MRWCLSTPGSAEYIVPFTLSTSVTLKSLINCRCSLKMYLEAVIKHVWRCTWRLRSSELRDGLGGREWAKLVMHMEAVIECLGRYTWRRWSIKIGGEFEGGRSRGDWSEGGESGGSECGGSDSGGSRSGGMCDWSWDSIHWLTHNCGNVEIWVHQGPLGADRLAWSGRQLIVRWCSMRCMQYSEYAVLSVCWTQSLLNSVYAVLGVCCTWCELMIMAWRDREGWLNILFSGDSGVEDEKEGDDTRWGKWEWETQI